VGTKETVPMDLVYLALTLALFGLSLGLIRVCDRL
jgi:hypothetical protein